MKSDKKYFQNKGFTLLELMAVMLIMFMLMGMATVAMKGMIKGSGISGATSNVRSVLTQARQYAIMKEQRVYVILENEDDKSSMTVCAKYGVCDGKGFNDASYKNHSWYSVILEDPLPWGTNSLVDATVYNLSRTTKNIGTIADNPEIDKICVERPPGIIWGDGDSVGFEVAEKRYLPSGMEFDAATVGNPNNPMIFNPDGSAGKNYSLEIIESNVANPATIKLKVNGLTGWIEVIP